MQAPFTRQTIRLLQWVECGIVVAMIVLLMGVLVVAVVDLFSLFITGTREKLAEVSTSADFQQLLQNAFGGILVIFVGLELLETMRAYFAEHHFRVEVILFVAIIATGRHIVLLDTHHTPPMTYLGLGSLMLALTASYFLLKRSSGR
jgi:uncharacterized membrane protein (DUF373 family)